MHKKLKQQLPNPFAVDYQYKPGEQFDLYTEDQMIDFAETMINECFSVLNLTDADLLKVRNHFEVKMNKRIHQLALKAGMEDFPTRGVNTLYGDREIEKFANLIIQECIECIQDGIMRNGTETPENQRSYSHIRAIQSRFTER